MFRSVRTVAAAAFRARPSKFTPGLVSSAALVSRYSIISRMSSSAPGDSSTAAAGVSGGLNGTPLLTAHQVQQTHIVTQQDDVSRSPSSLSGPLVWIDLEMTGLNRKVDKIMEIAVLITNGNLELIDEGIQFVVHVDKERLDKMDEWCTQQHGSTGLTQACSASPHTLSAVERAVLEYVQKHIPEKRVGVLAGNSVHVDKEFLAEQMPSLVDHLHYRIVDVSSIKELCRRWYSGTTAPRMVAESDAHRALDDIRGSIRELQWYRENIFVRPEMLVSKVE